METRYVTNETGERVGVILSIVAGFGAVSSESGRPSVGTVEWTDELARIQARLESERRSSWA